MSHQDGFSGFSGSHIGKMSPPHVPASESKVKLPPINESLCSSLAGSIVTVPNVVPGGITLPVRSGKPELEWVSLPLATPIKEE